jgi:cell division protein FtsW
MIALIMLGLVMLYSTSSVRNAVPFFYLKRQAIWLAIGVIAGVFVVRIDYHVWQKLSLPMFLFSVVLLAALFIPNVGIEVNGSTRWIGFGAFRVQPSELAKFTSVVCMASWMSVFSRQIDDMILGFLIPIAGLGVLGALVFFEPDFGTSTVIIVVGAAIMFAAGAKIWLLLLTCLLGSGALSVAVYFNKNRRGRILSFLWPDKYPDQAYHLTQSKIAIIMGGGVGVGLGNSLQKHFYLPEAHTDFIFSIIAEEFGFAGAAIVVCIFLGYFLGGMYISAKAVDPFGRLLGFGITMMISLQAAFNIGVVTGCLPTKGLALPFISYGGSSLVMAIVMSAVLLNIAQHTDPEERIKDRLHRL